MRRVAELCSTSTEPHSRGKVLLVAPQPFYQDRGSPIAVRYTLAALSELGYDVKVLTFPLGCATDLPRVRIIRAANPLGFRTIPIGFSVKKILLDALLMRLLWKHLREERYLFIHAVEEAAFFATLLCRHRVFVAYDMHSCLPEQLAHIFGFRTRRVQAICRYLERWVLSNVNYVACSSGLLEHVRSVAPAVRCHEWRFPSASPTVSAGELDALREELRIPGNAQVVLYAGTFATYQGMSILAEAIPLVAAHHPRTVFVLLGAGTGDQVKWIRERIRPVLESNVRLLSRQYKQQVERFLALADVLVSPRIHGANLPLKIFDYLAAGKPIIASDIPAHRAILDDSRAILVQPSAEALASAISGVLSDPQRAARLGATARAYAEEWLTWPRFLASVNEICEAARADLPCLIRRRAAADVKYLRGDQPQ